MQVTDPAYRASQLPDPREAALFLDFDGTLVDIAATPEAISVAPDLDHLLGALRRRLSDRIAIISGRGIDDLSKYMSLGGITVVGGHGAEMAQPGKPREMTVDANTVAAVHAAVTKAQRAHSAIYAEYKPTGAVMHYRQNPQVEGAAWDAARAIAADFPAFDLQPSKMAVELRPRHASKAAAVTRLMQDPPFAGHKPVFAGDDATDVPAMAVCMEMGGAAIGVGPVDATPTLRVHSPQDLRRILSHWSTA